MPDRSNKGGRDATGHALQLGIGSYTYGWQVGVTEFLPARPLTVENLIAKAAAFGLGLVQVGDNHPLAEYADTRLSAIKGELRAASMTMEIGARGLTTGRLKEYIELAEYFRASLLRFIIDGSGYEPEPGELISILKERSKHLERRGISLAIENHDRMPAPVLAGIIEAVGSARVGICLDTVNSLGAGEGLGSVLDFLAPHTMNLHIKDFTIVRLPHKMGFRIEGAPAGSGFLDIPALLEKVGSAGRCRTAILEQWVPPENNIEQTIVKEEQWARESINYLKTIREWQ